MPLRLQIAAIFCAPHNIYSTLHNSQPLVSRRQEDDKMPHTNRKNQASGPVGAEFTHSNRRTVQDDAGWSHVVNVRGGAGGRRTTKHTVKLPTKNGEYAYASSSIAQMHKHLDFYSEKWAGDRASQELYMMLDDSNSGVENVVCLGLGSLHNANSESQRASWMQLVALRTILDTLGMYLIISAGLSLILCRSHC